MPLPKPQKNESQDDFISRCMSDTKMKDEFPDRDQRLAICHQQISESQNLYKAIEKFYEQD